MSDQTQQLSSSSPPMPLDQASHHNITESMLVGMLDVLASDAIAAAEALIGRGDSDYGMVHSHRYEAIKILWGLMDRLIGWYGECETTFIVTEIAPAVAGVAEEVLTGRGDNSSVLAAAADSAAGSNDAATAASSGSSSSGNSNSIGNTRVTVAMLKEMISKGILTQRDAMSSISPSSSSSLLPRLQQDGEAQQQAPLLSQSSVCGIAVTPTATFTSVVTATTVAKCLVLMGSASIAAQETLNGYKLCEHGVVVLEHVQLHGKGLTHAQYEALLLSLKRQYVTSGGMPPLVFCAKEHYLQFANQNHRTKTTRSGCTDDGEVEEEEDGGDDAETTSSISLKRLGLGPYHCDDEKTRNNSSKKNPHHRQRPLHVFRERASFVGASILLEAYIYMCMCASRWDNADATAALLNAAYRLQQEVRQRREAMKREEKVSRISRLHEDADSIELQLKKKKEEEQNAQGDALKAKLEARRLAAAARRQKQQQQEGGGGGDDNVKVPAPPTEPNTSPPRPSLSAQLAPPSSSPPAATSPSSSSSSPAGSGAAAVIGLAAAASSPSHQGVADAVEEAVGLPHPPQTAPPSTSPRRTSSMATSAEPLTSSCGVDCPPLASLALHSTIAFVNTALPFIQWSWGLYQNGVIVSTATAAGIGGAEGTSEYMQPIRVIVPPPPQPTAPTTTASSASSPPPPPTTTAVLPLIHYDTLLLLYYLHRCSFDTESSLQRVEGLLLTSTAQVNKTANSYTAAAFCHKSLAYQVEKRLLKTAADVGDWVNATLTLAEYYITKEDLSHAEHCLLAIEAILEASKVQVPRVIATTAAAKKKGGGEQKGENASSDGSSGSGSGGEGGEVYMEAAGGVGIGMCEKQFTLPQRSLKGAGLGPFLTTVNAITSPTTTTASSDAKAKNTNSASSGAKSSSSFDIPIASSDSQGGISSSNSRWRPHSVVDLWPTFDVLQYHFIWACFYHRVMMLGQSVVDGIVAENKKGRFVIEDAAVTRALGQAANAGLTFANMMAARRGNTLGSGDGVAKGSASLSSPPPAQQSQQQAQQQQTPSLDSLATVLRPLSRLYLWVTSNAYLNPALLPEEMRSAPTQQKEAFLQHNCGFLLGLSPAASKKEKKTKRRADAGDNRGDAAVEGTLVVAGKKTKDTPPTTIERKTSLSLEEALTGVADEDRLGGTASQKEQYSWCYAERIRIPLPNVPPPRTSFTFAMPRKLLTNTTAPDRSSSGHVNYHHEEEEEEGEENAKGSEGDDDDDDEEDGYVKPEAVPLQSRLFLKANRSTIASVLPSIVSFGKGRLVANGAAANSNNNSGNGGGLSPSSIISDASLLLTEALQSAAWPDHCQQRLLFHLMAVKDLATVDKDFEKFLHCKRMEADSWSVCYGLSDMPIVSVETFRKGEEDGDAEAKDTNNKEEGGKGKGGSSVDAVAAPLSVTASLKCLPTHKDDTLLQLRVSCLQSILDTGLSPKSYRNVIRSAEFDCGASCMLIALNTQSIMDTLKLGGTVVTAGNDDSSSEEDEKSSSSSPLLDKAQLAALEERRASYLEQALAYYKAFVAAFHTEMSNAKANGKTIASALEDSDYPTIVVGEMRVAEVLLKMNRLQEAEERLETHVQAFINDNPNMLAKYPELAASKAQCDELLTVLRTLKQSKADANSAGGGGGGTAPANLRSVAPSATTTSGDGNSPNTIMDAIE